MHRLPARQGLGVVSGGGCRGRGLRSTALAAVYCGTGLGLAAALAACDGPKTGPGLEPPRGGGVNGVMTVGQPMAGNPNGGSFGNTGNGLGTGGSPSTVMPGPGTTDNSGQPSSPSGAAGMSAGPQQDPGAGSGQTAGSGGNNGGM